MNDSKNQSVWNVNINVEVSLNELNELLNTYPLNEREMLSSHIIAILEKRH